MESNSPFSGTIRAIYANWPTYALSYGAIILAMVVIGVSAQLGLIGFIPLTLAFLIILELKDPHNPLSAVTTTIAFFPFS